MVASGLVSYNFCMIPLVCSRNFGYSNPVDRGGLYIHFYYTRYYTFTSLQSGTVYDVVGMGE